jgi:hypothetical protein
MNVGAQLLRLKDAETVSNGVALAFTMETTQGDFRLHIPMQDIGNVVAYFVGAAANAYAEGDNLPDAEEAPKRWAPIPTLGLGVARSDTPDETTDLIVRLPGFFLEFEIPNSELALAAETLRQKAKPSPT